MLDSLTFPRLDIWRKKNWRSKPVRFVPDCCIVARIKLVDKEFWIDGAVLSVTSSRALFREASSYMLMRHNEEILLEMESVEYPAQIITTDENGYRIEFVDDLPEGVVTDLRDRWRIDS